MVGFMTSYLITFFRSIPSLSVKTLPGTKLALTQPLEKRGLLFLTKQTVEILPGYVPSLAERTRTLEQPRRDTNAFDLGGIAELPEEDDYDDQDLLNALQSVEEQYRPP